MVALSTSWLEQQEYESDSVQILSGLMFPCPEGKVPYSRQLCFSNGREWPDTAWVVQQVHAKRIQFFGEVLTQYAGLSMSDSAMYPYYAIAERLGLPVGIHTGSAGPDHGCPNFSEEMGNPSLLRPALKRFPMLKLWLMHGGSPYTNECIGLMKEFPHVYADISVLNNPQIIPPQQFTSIMKQFLEAGLEDRLLFGSDNADIRACINAVKALDILAAAQRDKIFHQNAVKLFGLSRNLAAR